METKQSGHFFNNYSTTHSSLWLQIGYNQLFEAGDLFRRRPGGVVALLYLKILGGKVGRHGQLSLVSQLPDQFT